MFFVIFDVFWWPTGVPVLVTISTSTLIWRLAETTLESTFVETSNVQLHFGRKGTFLVPFGGHWLSKDAMWVSIWIKKPAILVMS